MLSEAIYRAQYHCNIHLLLHDRAGTSTSLLKLKSRPSVRISAVDARINIKLEAPVFWDDEVYFKVRNGTQYRHGHAIKTIRFQ